MRSRLFACLLPLLAVVHCGGKAALESSSGGVGSPDAGGSDSPGSTCDISKPFGTPVPVPGVNADKQPWHPSLSPDELTIYFAGDFGADNIYTATRPTRDASFSPPTKVIANVPPKLYPSDPSISSDGLTLYFTNWRAFQESYVYSASRSRIADMFTIDPYPVPGFDKAAGTSSPFLSSDGQTLYYDAGGYLMRRASWTGSGWGPEGAVINDAEDHNCTAKGSFRFPDGCHPVVSSDGRTLFLSKVSVNGANLYEWRIWFANRTNTSGPFGSPKQVTELGGWRSDLSAVPGWLSPDGCRLYFSAWPTGANYLQRLIYVAERGR